MEDAQMQQHIFVAILSVNFVTFYAKNRCVLLRRRTQHILMQVSDRHRKYLKIYLHVFQKISEIFVFKFKYLKHFFLNRSI